jgi:hypothetical protein
MVERSGARATRDVDADHNVRRRRWSKKILWPNEETISRVRRPAWGAPPVAAAGVSVVERGVGRALDSRCHAKLLVEVQHMEFVAVSLVVGIVTFAAGCVLPWLDRRESCNNR